jgi:hypothetical protein
MPNGSISMTDNKGYSENVVRTPEDILNWWLSKGYTEKGIEQGREWVNCWCRNSIWYGESIPGVNINDDLRRGKRSKRHLFDNHQIKLHLNQRIDMDSIFITVDRSDPWLQLKIRLSDGSFTVYYFDRSKGKAKSKASRELVEFLIWYRPNREYITINSDYLEFKEWMWVAAKNAGIYVSNYQPSEKRKRELLG